MSIPNDDVSLAAHNAFLLYFRHLSELPKEIATVPRHWVEELLNQLLAVLDENDELHNAIDPPAGGYDEDPALFEEITEWGAEGTQLETDY